jgi:hypothetical protein
MRRCPQPYGGVAARVAASRAIVWATSSVSGLLRDQAQVGKSRSRGLRSYPRVAVVALGRPPHRARGGHDPLIRDRPPRSVCWADIPQLSAWDASCPAAWQQRWQQSRHPGADPWPSAFRPGVGSYRHVRHERLALPPFADPCWGCYRRCCYPRLARFDRTMPNLSQWERSSSSRWR